MKIIITVVAIFWLVVITGLIIFNIYYTGEKVKTTPNYIQFNEQDILTSGPEIGATLTQQELPSEVIARFLQHINVGEYDEASGLMEPNYLYEIVSAGDSSIDGFKKFFHIFSPGEMKSLRVETKIEGNLQSEVKAVLEIENQEKIEFTFYLREYPDGSHEETNWLWMIVGYE